MTDTASPLAPAPDLCPRCGGRFRCGVLGEAPCPCTTVTLPLAVLEGLRQRYVRCLCLSCLQALAAGAPLEPPAR